jgi:hypothetical protein
MKNSLKQGDLSLFKRMISSIYLSLSLSLSLIILFTSLVFFPSCASLNKVLAGIKPTGVERVSFKPTCKPSWKGKTIYIDFDTNSGIWYHSFASNLSQNIRDQLIEDVVEDGCFHIQDISTGMRYSYKVGVIIANPLIRVSGRNVIQSIQANFRIKTYDGNNNLITAMTRPVKYVAPSLTITINDSQDELLANYAYNVSVDIRKTVYASFK